MVASSFEEERTGCSCAFHFPSKLLLLVPWLTNIFLCIQRTELLRFINRHNPTSVQ